MSNLRASNFSNIFRTIKGLYLYKYHLSIYIFYIYISLSALNSEHWNSDSILKKKKKMSWSTDKESHVITITNHSHAEKTSWQEFKLCGQKRALVSATPPKSDVMVYLHTIRYKGIVSCSCVARETDHVVKAMLAFLIRSDGMVSF